MLQLNETMRKAERDSFREARLQNKSFRRPSGIWTRASLIEQVSGPTSVREQQTTIQEESAFSRCPSPTLIDQRQILLMRINQYLYFATMYEKNTRNEIWTLRRHKYRKN